MSSHSGLHQPVSETKHFATGSTRPDKTANLTRLYSMKFCPYAQRTRLVLAAKRVPHDVVNINLSTKPEWYFELNPLGKVPCLEFDGHLIFESLITADYLDEAHPEPRLHSNDIVQKAKDRIFVELFNQVVAPMYKLYRGKEDEEQWNKTIASFQEGLKIFEDELVKRGSVYFSGPKPGMLDYMIWPWIERMFSLPILTDGLLTIPHDKYPKLIKWAEAMKEDDAVKQSFISPENHAKFFRSHFAGKPDYDMEI